jgi:hypothetical protein
MTTGPHYIIINGGGATDPALNEQFRILIRGHIAEGGDYAEVRQAIVLALDYLEGRERREKLARLAASLDAWQPEPEEEGSGDA